MTFVKSRQIFLILIAVYFAEWYGVSFATIRPSNRARSASCISRLSPGTHCSIGAIAHP